MPMTCLASHPTPARIFLANEGYSSPHPRCPAMTIEIQTTFAFSADTPTDVLLQFEAALIPEQVIEEASLTITPPTNMARVPAHNDIGERIWLRAEGEIEVSMTARVTPQRIVSDLASLDQMSPRDLPGEVIEYLFDSRYCQADKLQSFVNAEFDELMGGARIAAMRDWIADNFTYLPGSSTAETGAVESFVERRGICRDYAHVLIALARASTIPARYVACYAPGVQPPDFHAVAEVFLADPSQPNGGAWHIVDATNMADPAQTIKIGVGRDAADVSFLTSFGPSNFLRSDVQVKVAQ